MSTQQQDNQHRDQEKQARQERKTVIGKHVIHTLGQPSHLHGVQVRHLWEDHYRVNILVGLDAASAKVAHSYFLVADSDGNIVASTPKITTKRDGNAVVLANSLEVHCGRMAPSNGIGKERLLVHVVSVQDSVDGPMNLKVRKRPIKRRHGQNERLAFYVIKIAVRLKVLL